MEILHLSDLHFQRGNAGQHNLLTDALLKDIDKLSGKPELIVFSGDLVHNPDDEDIYLALSDYIENILLACGLTESSLVLCPGNHDVSHKAIKSNTLEYDALKGSRGDQAYIEKLYSEGRLHQYLSDTGKPFFDFCDLFSIKWSNPFFHVLHSKDMALSVIALNSTLNCSLEGSAADQGQLGFPLEALERALATVDEGRRVLTVAHHPMESFSEGSIRILRPRIMQKSLFHLCGHFHAAVPTLSKTPAGECLFLQSGALYATKEYFKGYCSLSSEGAEARRKVEYRTYIDARGEFDEGTAVAHRGLFYPSAEDERYWTQDHVPPLDQSAFGAWLKGDCLISVRAELDNSFIEESLLETFVFPAFAEQAVGESTDGVPESSKGWGYEEIASTPRNVILMYAEEFGATSTLAYLAMKQCSNAHQFGSNRIPLFVDMKHLKNYPQSIVRGLKNAHPAVDHAVFGWKALDKYKPYLVLVDNFDPYQNTHVDILNEIYGLLKQSRFIICARTALSSLGHVIPSIVISFSASWLSIKPFNRRRVRLLVQKYRLPPAFQENYVVEEIITRFNSLSVPLAGPHIAMYLMVLRAQKKFTPINASTVIENFVESLLEKPNLKHIYRSAFDFREKASLLGYIAEDFARREVDSASYEDVHARIEKFYEDIGLDRNAFDVMADFLDARVLERSANQISFKYTILYSFFIAYRMTESTEFKDHVLSFDRFVEFVHELDIYCGLRRGDVDVLTRVAGYFERVDQEARTEIGVLMAQDGIARLQLPIVRPFDEFVSKMTDEISSELPQEDADAALDHEPGSFVQRFKTKKLRNVVFRWLFSLRVYSVCLKNLETIEKDHKEKHLAAVLDGWAAGVALAVRVAGVCFEGKTVDFGGVKVGVELGRHVDGRVLRWFIANLPATISVFMKTELGTEKLSQQMKGLEGMQKPISDLLRVGLMADLKANEFLSQVKRFMTRVAKSQFLTEAMMWKLRDVYLRYGFSEVEGTAFTYVIAEADSNLKGLTGASRTKNISDIIQGIKRRRLLRNS